MNSNMTERRGNYVKIIHGSSIAYLSSMPKSTVMTSTSLEWTAAWSESVTTAHTIKKIISKDLFSGEYREYDAVFIETSYVVLNKNGDALCGFDNPSDLIYWAQTGIASTLYSKY